MSKLYCPECEREVEAKALDARPTIAGEISAIRRRRVCPRGHRWSTVEVPDDHVPRLLDSKAPEDPFAQALYLIRKAYRLLDPGSTPKRGERS